LEQVFGAGAYARVVLNWRNHMAQTIWLHRLPNGKKAEAEGMEYICEHLFKGLTQDGKLTKAKGWNAVQDASAKDGSTYRSLFCDACEKNYSNGNVRMAREAVLV
jgi:hypothetical protein